MEQIERCNLCGGSRFALFAEVPGQKTKRLFRIVTCETCSLMFVAPRLSASENTALYDEAYFNGKGFDGSVNYVMFDEAPDTRSDENLGILGKLAVLKPGRHVRVLDMGCGTGCLLRALREAGYDDVWGVELSTYAAARARSVEGAKVFTGDILDVDLPLASFDVINATEVIEHLRDPRASFQRIESLLAPGGVVIYSTGNAHGIYARVLGKRWPYLHPEGHLFYFNPETLTRYFREVGLLPAPFTELDPSRRDAYLRAEDQMAHSMLQYIGAGDKGMKARIFRTVAALDHPIVQRAVTRVVGKHWLPVAVKPGVS